MPNSDTIDPRTLIDQIVQLSIDAGDEILYHYETGFSVEMKPNKSPVTPADKGANNVIIGGLQRLTPSIPIVSEESKIPDYSERSRWRQYWLIDPLDGTKSFVNKGGQFTVNIALIEGQTSIMGVVHSPVEKRTYWGIAGEGAYCKEGGETKRIQVGNFSGSFANVISPTSRGLKETDTFVSNVENASITCKLQQSSSSIKFCRVAEGAADVFPSFSKTSEWDTAAAQCVVESAGGKVVDFDGNSLIYNKPNIKNPMFLASGGGDIDWLKFL